MVNYNKKNDAENNILNIKMLIKFTKYNLKTLSLKIKRLININN